MYNKSSQMQARNEVRTAIQAGYKFKECLHPEAPENCHGDIIKAHSVQKSGSLRKIAENGHVLTPVIDFYSNKFNMQKIGINKASTFTGFCKFHDNELFSPIEDRPLELIRHHAFLIAYRCLSKELYNKRRNADIDTSRNIDNSDMRALVERTDEVLRIGTRRALSTDMQMFDKMQNAISRNQFRETKFYAFEIDAIPEIMCSGVTNANYDFNRNKLQNVAGYSPLELITLSLLPYRGHGVVFFAWYGKSKVNRKLINSLLSLSDSQIPDAILRFIFHYFENFFVAPSWWNQLPDYKKQGLSDRFESSFDPKTFPYVDMTPDGLEYVNWRVIKTKTNLKV